MDISSKEIFAFFIIISTPISITINLFLAHKKRRNKITWFLISIFFGFISVFMLLMMKEEEITKDGSLLDGRT